MLPGTRLFSGGHCLPLTVFDHPLHSILERKGHRDQQIGALRNFRDDIAGTGVSGEHDHAAGCLEAIGIGFVLTGTAATVVQIEMAVFDGHYLNIGVLVNHPGADIMTEEHLGNRYTAPAVGNPEFGTDGEILHGGFDQRFGSGRAVDIDRPGPPVVPSNRHQRAKTCGVVVVVMSNENGSDVAGVDASFCETSGDAVAGIDDIMCPIHSEKIGRLRSARSGQRAAAGSERDQSGAGLRLQQLRLRPAAEPAARQRPRPDAENFYGGEVS